MIAVTVKIPNEDERVVIVDNADDEMHARLAAYYYIHLQPVAEPTKEELRELTSVHRTNGPVNANIYRNPWRR